MIEAIQALRDAYITCREWGEEHEFLFRDEDDVRRGSLGSVQQRSVRSVRLHVYPLVVQPQQVQLSKAGLSQPVKAVLWVSAREISDMGLIDLARPALDVSKTTVVVDSKELPVKEVSFVNRVGGVPCYVTFGVG